MLTSESIRLLCQKWRDRRAYSSISSFKEWWDRVDYLVTNIIFVVKDFLFGKDGGDKRNSSPQMPALMEMGNAEGVKKDLKQ